METTRTQIAGAKPRCLRSRRWIAGLALIALALALAGCGKPVPPYWPDMTIDGDTLYVAEANGQVFALQADAGAVLWSYPTIEAQSGGLLGGCSPAAPSDGPFHAAPAVGEEFVFLGSAGQQQRSLWGAGENKSGLRVLDRMGTLQWEFRGTSDATVTAPTLAEGTLYLPSSDHHVYAVDVSTRETHWTFETGNWVWASPLVIQDQVFIASTDHVLYAVDVETGRAIWSFDRSTSALLAAPAYAEGILYLGSLDGHVYAVRAETGQLVWEQTLAGGIWSTPLLVGDVLYLGTLKGNVHALHVATGTQVWTRSVAGQVRGTPAHVNGVVYLGCEDGQLYAFDAETGTPGISPLGRQLENASIYTSPVTDGRYLYIVATDGNVFALDPVNSGIVWQTNPLENDQEGS